MTANRSRITAILLRKQLLEIYSRLQTGRKPEESVVYSTCRPKRKLRIVAAVVSGRREKGKNSEQKRLMFHSDRGTAIRTVTAATGDNFLDTYAVGAVQSPFTINRYRAPTSCRDGQI